jgi:4-amino-4-deoxy-L-arabinose transferase-like glycosyltransferase
MTTAAPAQRRSETSTADTIRTIAARLALPAILLIPILLYLPFLQEPFEGDEGAHGTIAQQMMHGSLPYRDLFDHKPPLIYVWYAASFLLFGENIVAPRIAAALVWSATTFLVFLQAKMILTKRQAYIASFLFAMSCSLTMLSFNANTEVFLLLPLLGSTIAFTKTKQTGNWRWLLLCGACGALAALTKQVAVWNMVALALIAAVPLIRAKDYRRLLTEQAAMAGSALVVLLIVLIPWIVSGALSDFYYGTVTYNGMYSNRLTLSERVLFTWYGMQAFMMVSAPYVGLTLLALPFAIRRRSWADVLIVGSLAGAMFGVATSGLYFRHHFVVALPFMALVAAPFLENVFTRPGTKMPFVLTMTLLVSLGLFFNLPAFLGSTPEERHLAKFLNAQGTRENAVHRVAAFMRANTAPGEPIYDYGRATQVYFYADRPPAIAFMYDRPFWLDDDTLTRGLKELWANPPRYVTDSVVFKDDEEWHKYHPPEVLDWFRANYDFIQRIEFADVYQRKAVPDAPGEVSKPYLPKGVEYRK